MRPYALGQANQRPVAKSTSTAIARCVRTEGIPEKMRGSRVGALCSWCHCPLSKSEGNLTATRRCGTATPANPSDGRCGYRAPLLQDNARETSTEKRKKREEKEGAHHRKTSRGKAGLVKLVPRHLTNSLPVPLQSSTGRFCKVSRVCFFARPCSCPLACCALWP